MLISLPYYDYDNVYHIIISIFTCNTSLWLYLFDKVELEAFISIKLLGNRYFWNMNKINKE